MRSPKILSIFIKSEAISKPLEPIYADAVLSDQNVYCLSYNIIEECLAKILLDQDDRANRFCPIICVFARSYDR